MIAMTTRQTVVPIIAASPKYSQMSQMIANPSNRYTKSIFGTMHDGREKHNQPNALCSHNPGESDSELNGLVSDQSGQTLYEQGAANMPIMAKRLHQNRGIYQ